MTLSPEQSRLSIDMADLYDIWIAAERERVKGRLRWKTINGKDYLYRMNFGNSNGSSMGARSPATEDAFTIAQQFEEQAVQTWKRLLVKGRMHKAIKRPVVDGFVGDFLRALDVQSLMGTHVRVVGSFALPAYELESGTKLHPDLRATEDFDLSWISDGSTCEPPQAGLMEVLKSLDATWTVNQEKTFRATNRIGQMVDLICAPDLYPGFPRASALRALPTEGQEWLLGGVPVEHVVCDSAGKPARMVAPDPRLFAIHKLYLSQKDDRRLDKRIKDHAQACAVLEMIDRHMPNYPLDADFFNETPLRLRETFDAWRGGNLPCPSGIKVVPRKPTAG